MQATPPSPPFLFVVGTFIACSYTSVVAFAKYLEILLMASFELHIAGYKYGGWGLCILIHIAIALKLFVTRKMFLFIYIRAIIGICDSQKIRFPLSTKHNIYFEGGVQLEVSFPLKLEWLAFFTVLSILRFKHFIPKATTSLSAANRETESGSYTECCRSGSCSSRVTRCTAASRLTPSPPHFEKHRKHQK